MRTLMYVIWILPYEFIIFTNDLKTFPYALNFFPYALLIFPYALNLSICSFGMSHDSFCVVFVSCGMLSVHLCIFSMRLVELYVWYRNVSLSFRYLCARYHGFSVWSPNISVCSRFSVCSR